MHPHRDPIFNANREMDLFLRENADVVELQRRTPPAPHATAFALRLRGLPIPVLDGDGYRVRKGAQVALSFPASYPSEPPAVFVPRAFHPNVSGKRGSYMCWLPVGDWRPSLTVKEMLTGIMQILCGGEFEPLLADPFPDDEVCVQATRLFIRLKREGRLPFTEESPSMRIPT